MHKILQTHLLRTFVANSKNDAVYALYPESFCDKNLAILKVFVFSDSGSLEVKSDQSEACLNDFDALWVGGWMEWDGCHWS